MAKGSQVSPDLKAREYSYVGPECMIGPKVELGPYAMLGPRVSVVGDDHRFDQPGTPIIFSGRPVLKSTVIEADAWIGCGAILLTGVRVGRGAIVAAGAVVTRDVPPYEIHGGVPARKISERFPEGSARQTHDRMLAETPRQGEYCPPLEGSSSWRRRKWLRLAAAGAVMGLVTLELLLRWICGLGHPLLLQKDPDIGYLYQPNQSLRRLGRAVIINAYHQRSGPATAVPASGVTRILFLGDSVTFGTTLLDQRQTIPELLQANLRKAQMAPAEVLNASAGSWGIGNQLAYLRRFGLMGSRIVVFQVGSGDLLQRKSTSARVGVDPAMPDKLPLTALGELWQRYLRPSIVGARGLGAPVGSEGAEAELQFVANMNFLTEAILLVRKSGATPVILHTPDRDEVTAKSGRLEAKYEPWRRRFMTLAARENVPVLNLRELWRNQPRALEYFRDHVHLTAAGSAAVARTVGDFLRESCGHVLPKPTPQARSMSIAHRSHL
jgi:carbonic anhydrase/acetyltransferase-like protein (isoleucine patch superfamily)/lysophospholipase L1-like esterase